jgi:hypothetical protein
MLSPECFHPIIHLEEPSMYGYGLVGLIVTVILVVLLLRLLGVM